MTGSREIDAILAEMRADGHTGPSDATDWLVAKLRAYADRIEAAVRKERAILDANIARVRKLEGMLGNAADAILGCAIKQKQSASSNDAAMRDLLERLASIDLDEDIWDEDGADGRKLHNFVIEARAALATPARNCDVGTAEEQGRRFLDQFDEWRVKNAGKTVIEAVLAWAQMPFAPAEEGRS